MAKKFFSHQRSIRTFPRRLRWTDKERGSGCQMKSIWLLCRDASILGELLTSEGISVHRSDVPRLNVAMPGLKHWLTPEGVPLLEGDHSNFTILVLLARKNSTCYLFGCVHFCSLDGDVCRCVQICVIVYRRDDTWTFHCLWGLVIVLFISVFAFRLYMQDVMLCLQ